MITEDDLYSIGRRCYEKKAALGPVGIGALGGAGFGLLNHFLRPKDKDDRGIGSMLLSALTGAGIGAAGGLAYKSLGSNPFDPGPSQTARTNTPTPLGADREDAIRASIGAQFAGASKPPAAGAENKDIVIQPDPGNNPPTPEEVAAITAAVGQNTPPTQPAVAEGTTAPAAQPAQPPAQQQIANGKAQEEQKPQEQPKKTEGNTSTFFKPSEANSEKYEALAKNNPGSVMTPEELIQKAIEAEALYGTRGPLVQVPGQPAGVYTFAKNVPFQMTEEIAFRSASNDNALVDPNANFTRIMKEQLAPAVKNGWWCVADGSGRIMPLVATKAGIIPAVLDPIYDPTVSTMSRAWDEGVRSAGGAAAVGGDYLGQFWNLVRRGRQSTKDAIGNAVGSSAPSF